MSYQQDPYQQGNQGGYDPNQQGNQGGYDPNQQQQGGYDPNQQQGGYGQQQQQGGYDPNQQQQRWLQILISSRAAMVSNSRAIMIPTSSNRVAMVSNKAANKASRVNRVRINLAAQSSKPRSK